MSTNLYWKPVRPQKNETLGDGLKWAIREYYGNGPVILTCSDVPFLKGVRAAQYPPPTGCLTGNEIARDCNTLIDAIEASEYGVSVWIAE